MIAALVIILAAFFKAVADTLAHHFGSSVFRWKNPKWWNPAVSWEHVGFIRFTKYRADAWHLANTGMIVCFCSLGAVPRPDIPWWALLLCAGALFNLSFNLFYNKILR